MTSSIKGSVALITGAGQGLGKEIALALAREDFFVYLIGKTEKKLRSVEELIKQMGGKTDCVVTDVSEDSTDYIDAIISKHGQLDILVNNAGWSPVPKPVEELTHEELEKTIRTNLLSIFYLLKKTIPIFKKQDSGIIINISSRAGKSGYPRLSAYSATKFAVEGLTQAVAKELEHTRVKCFSVAPGALNTPMRNELFGDAEMKEDPAKAAKAIIGIIDGTIIVQSGDSVNI